MGKKKNDKVVSLVGKQEEPQLPTQEEIAAQMAKDEAELDGYLNRFKTVALPDSGNVVEEEDEDEEVFTLDLDTGIAYEKVGEGVAVRNEDGKFAMVDDFELEEKIKKMVTEQQEPTLQQRYQDMITDRFVSKAISSLVDKYSRAARLAADNVQDTIGGEIGYALGDKVYEEVRKQKEELRAAIAGGRVNYDKIPTWAQFQIDEYIQDSLTALIDFVERD